MRIKLLIGTLMVVVILLGTSITSSPVINRLPSKTIVHRDIEDKERTFIFGPPPTQAVFGYVNYNDSSWVPNGAVVTATNLKNNNSITTNTRTLANGHTGGYIFYDIFIIPGTEDGDTIKFNISYGGCTGNNTLVIDITLPSQQCDVTIYGNLPPRIPGQPSGPASGYINITYNYSTSTWDPDNDDIYYWFDWNDSTNSGWVGPYSSNETCNASHSWNEPGTYQVKAKAKDEHGAELGTLWSNSLNVTINSHPPNTPSTPSGPTFLNIDESGTYSTSANDPDGDQVQYRFDWDANGTHDYSDWTALVPSGTPASMNHSWDSGGTFVVKAQARDEYNTTGNWSSGLSVFINSPPNTPSDPEPEDGATDVDIEADLSWSCSDPDGDDLTYNVYFEANDPTPDELVSENQTETTYDPGTMEYNTHYYWQIVAWDEHGLSTEGSVWDFTTMSEPNDPPNPPSDPTPEDDATDVSIDTLLSWTCSDPDGDPLVYDVYLEADDPTPDILVSDDQTGSTYNPGGLEYSTTYYWQIIAKDSHSATTPGPIWSFTTEEAIPDLNCEGSLTWTDVPPGGTVTGSFTVENNGDPTSLLDWEIESKPDWGTWTFTPDEGYDLTPEYGPFTVEVFVVAPDEKNQQYSGEVKIVNSEDSSDYCTILVSLATPVSVNHQFNFHPLIQKILELFPHMFPILRHMLGL